MAVDIRQGGLKRTGILTGLYVLCDALLGRVHCRQCNSAELGRTLMSNWSAAAIVCVRHCSAARSRPDRWVDSRDDCWALSPRRRMSRFDEGGESMAGLEHGLGG
jgi:hypothetical protein